MISIIKWVFNAGNKECRSCSKLVIIQRKENKRNERIIKVN